MTQVFCHASGLRWGQGIGVGAGGMVAAAPMGKGPMKNLGLAVDALVENIRHSSANTKLFVVPNFPRFLCKTAAHFGWEREARKNGLKAMGLYGKRE